MSGIVRLYAAFLQTPTKPHPHPHGLEHGWAWLARVLNMEPHPSLTATAVYDMLEVCVCVCSMFVSQYNTYCTDCRACYDERVQESVSEDALLHLQRLYPMVSVCLCLINQLLSLSLSHTHTQYGEGDTTSSAGSSDKTKAVPGEVHCIWHHTTAKGTAGRRFLEGTLARNSNCLALCIAHNIFSVNYAWAAANLCGRGWYVLVARKHHGVRFCLLCCTSVAGEL